jgi:hypothetical protein
MNNLCECGSFVTNFKEHLETQKHIDYCIKSKTILYNDLKKCILCNHYYYKDYKLHCKMSFHKKKIYF